MFKSFLQAPTGKQPCSGIIACHKERLWQNSEAFESFLIAFRCVRH